MNAVQSIHPPLILMNAGPLKHFDTLGHPQRRAPSPRSVDHHPLDNRNASRSTVTGRDPLRRRTPWDPSASPDSRASSCSTTSCANEPRQIEAGQNQGAVAIVGVEPNRDRHGASVPHRRASGRILADDTRTPRAEHELNPYLDRGPAR